MRVRHSTPEDDVDAFLAAHNADRVARKGELIHAVEDVARSAGCARLWLITTNDNLDLRPDQLELELERSL